MRRVPTDYRTPSGSATSLYQPRSSVKSQTPSVLAVPFLPMCQWPSAHFFSSARSSIQTQPAPSLSPSSTLSYASSTPLCSAVSHQLWTSPLLHPKPASSLSAPSSTLRLQINLSSYSSNARHIRIDTDCHGAFLSVYCLRRGASDGQSGSRKVQAEAGRSVGQRPHSL